MRNGNALDELDRYLGTADILDTATFDAQSPHAHPAYRLILEGAVAVLAKPADKIENGHLLVRREVAAWHIARELGWPDLVAGTVLRSVPSATGSDPVDASLQVIWPDCLPDGPVEIFPVEDIWRGAVLTPLSGRRTAGATIGWPYPPPAVLLARS